jgi:hypothetical protein
MLQAKNVAPRSHKLAVGSLLITGLLIVGSTPALSATKPETIEASAMGTGTARSGQSGERRPADRS